MFDSHFRLQASKVDFVNIPTQKIHTQPACRLNTLFIIIDLVGARDTLTSLTKARFDDQLLKANKALLEFADQVAQDDLRLPDKIKKPKWAKLGSLTASPPRGHSLWLKLLK